MNIQLKKAVDYIENCLSYPPKISEIKEVADKHKIDIVDVIRALPKEKYYCDCNDCEGH